MERMAKKAIVLGLTAGLAGLLAAGNAASKAGNTLSDLTQLGITFNTDRNNGLPLGTGSGKANVIDDRFRAIGDYLIDQE